MSTCSDARGKKSTSGGSVVTQRILVQPLLRGPGLAELGSFVCPSATCCSPIPPADRRRGPACWSRLRAGAARCRRIGRRHNSEARSRDGNRPRRRPGRLRRPVRPRRRRHAARSRQRPDAAARAGGDSTGSDSGRHWQLAGREFRHCSMWPRRCGGSLAASPRPVDVLRVQAGRANASLREPRLAGRPGARLPARPSACGGWGAAAMPLAALSHVLTARRRPARDRPLDESTRRPVPAGAGLQHKLVGSGMLGSAEGGNRRRADGRGDRPPRVTVAAAGAAVAGVRRRRTSKCRRSSTARLARCELKRPRPSRSISTAKSKGRRRWRRKCCRGRFRCWL